MGAADGLLRGGYALFEQAPNGLDLILIASGSEVELVFKAGQQLAAEGVGVRVVSLPCWELLEAQDDTYRQQLLPLETPKVAVEAASPFGWERWVGNDPHKSAIIGINHFGASAPYQRIYQEFGLTVENIVAHARRLLAA
jgi:transketolase